MASVHNGSDQPLLVLDHVHKTFGDTQAVKDVSFEVCPGTIFGLIGPSGSGKTTIIRLLCGIHQVTSGTIRVFGDDPYTLGPLLRARLGYMPQLFVLYPNLTVEQNLEFTAGLYGMSVFEWRKPKRVLLELVELWEHRHKLARKISGGMQRRLELACALIHNPRLLFLDEPTAGIDPILRAKMWDHFRELKSEGRTLFVTTQVVSEAENCDEVMLMTHGEHVASGSPEALRHEAYGGELVNITGPSLSREQMIQLEQNLAQRLQLSPGPMGVDKPTLASTQKSATPLADLEDQVDVTRIGPAQYQVRIPNAASGLPQILDALNEMGLPAKSAEPYRPPFDDVFVRLIHRWQTNQEAHSQSPVSVAVS